MRTQRGNDNDKHHVNDKYPVFLLSAQKGALRHILKQAKCIPYCKTGKIQTRTQLNSNSEDERMKEGVRALRELGTNSMCP